MPCTIAWISSAPDKRLSICFSFSQLLAVRSPSILRPRFGLMTVISASNRLSKNEYLQISSSYSISRRVLPLLFVFEVQINVASTIFQCIRRSPRLLVEFQNPLALTHDPSTEQLCKAGINPLSVQSALMMVFARKSASAAGQSS